MGHHSYDNFFRVDQVFVCSVLDADEKRGNKLIGLLPRNVSEVLSYLGQRKDKVEDAAGLTLGVGPTVNNRKQFLHERGYTVLLHVKGVQSLLNLTD